MSAPKLVSLATGTLLLVSFAIGCDAVRQREPKQAQDPVVQAPKYGNMKVDGLQQGEADGGAN
jgi:hypothetical protein